MTCSGSLRIAASTVIILTATALCAGESPGKKIFDTQCASCHGNKGQGVKGEYGEPLIGDWSVAELSEFISKRMPEGEPDTCVADDAQAVAAWIFEDFYSPAARARNHPPRIELARLTAQQYRNSIADIITEFTGANEPDEDRGLKAEYYDSRRFRRDKRIIQRNDATIDFDFGEGSPGDKIGKDEFSMEWIGGLIAPESGEYEFTVVTDNGIKLWVNESEPVVDGWVRSGDAVEHTATVRLLGGRMYYLKLHFFKYKEKTARIQLKWRRPHHASEVIPRRYLSPRVGGHFLIVNTDFPPEDNSYGYQRATSVSRAWHAATTNAAIEVSERMSDNLPRLARYKPDRDDSQKKLREFATRFTELALRRKLSDEQKQLFVDQNFKDAPDLVAALRRVVLLVLKSPSFLYREIHPGHDDFDIAARLSYTLWDSIPDRQLREVAERDALDNIHQLRFQAERMVRDPRTRVKLQEFLHQWLRMNHVADLSKDHDLFPGFDNALLADLRSSMDLLLNDVVWNERSDFRDLFLADNTWMNGRIAKFYGADLDENADFQKVSYQPQQRAGVVSHPFLMTGFAYHATTSPIHRGVFMARNLLGRKLKPPPDAVTPLPPELHADLTTRQRVALQTRPESCNTCHRMINPLGFSLENFDAVGRFRDKEKDKPIDAAGQYRTRSGETVKFTGARQLAEFLANSPEVHRAFVEQLFHHSMQQPILAFGTQTPDELTKQFADHEFNIQKLLASIATRAAVYENGIVIEARTKQKPIQK